MCSSDLKLPRYAMPPADRPVVAALLQPDRYLVTPEPAIPGDAAVGGAVDEAGWLAALDRALAAGVRRVQLRAPELDAACWRPLAARAVAACRAAGAQVLINGDVELAQALGAGLHLRAAQLAGLTARPVPTDVPLAASCHGIDELRMAESLGCDFAVVGNVQSTPSHPGRAPLGWSGFAALREAVSLPIYAIGGLGIGDIELARQHGAQGIAAIRALWPADS